MIVPKSFKTLCPPAMLYFVISIMFMMMALFQNLGDNRHYNLGDFSCAVPNTTVVFVVKLLYILFWTYILNLICKDGYTTLSWLLVLFPFVMLFAIIGLLMINMPK